MTRAGAPALPGARARPRSGVSARLEAVPAFVIALGVVFAFARAAPRAGPLALDERLARTIFTRGIPFGAESLGWLGALVTTAVSSLGELPFALACGFVAVAAMALVGRRAARWGANPAALLAVAFVVPCLLDALRPGADVGAWLFAAVAIALLDAPTPRRGIAFAIVSLAWCNLEPAGIFACALALLSLAGALCDATGANAPLESAALPLRAAIASAAGLALLCTPDGLAYPRDAFEALRLGDAVRGIVATTPAIVAPAAYHLGFFALLACALACGVRAHGLRGALPLAGTCVLALDNGAFVPIFGIVAAAPVAIAVARMVRYRTIIALGAPFVAVAAIAFAMRAQPTAPPEPYDLVARTAPEAGGRGTLFCAKIDWCDVAVARGARVVMDGRVAPYDARARAEQRAIGAAGRGFAAALARTETTRVLAIRDTPLAARLALEPAWRRVTSDAQATLFERRTP